LSADPEEVILIAGAILIIAVLVTVMVGKNWGLNGKAVVYAGKRDLVFSCLTPN
jgi:hypothetical protein